jgi:hypothetical protein
MSRYIAPTLVHPSDVKTFTFPSAPLYGGTFPDGRTLSSAALISQEKATAATGPWSTSTDLTIGAFTVGGSDGQSRVNGFVDGYFYRVTVRFTDSVGDTPTGEYFFECRKTNAGVP